MGRKIEKFVMPTHMDYQDEKLLQTHSNIDAINEVRIFFRVLNSLK